MRICSEVEEFASQLSATGWRGLLVLHTRSPIDSVESLCQILGGRLLVIADAETRKALEGRVDADLASYMDVEKLLGGEYDSVIVSSPAMLRPNVVAAAGEMVRASGVLGLVVPPLEEWNPGVPDGRGAFKKYLVSSLTRARSLLWLDADQCRTYRWEVPAGKARRPRWDPGSFVSKPRLPRGLVALAASEEQADLLASFARFLRGRFRSFAVIGDRGRGKSSLLGMALGLTIYWRMAGTVEVVAPSPYGSRRLMEMLVKSLDALGIPYRVVERGGVPVGVKGPWFRVYYRAPSRAEPAPLLVIDEAAAVGPARVRRLSWRSGRTVVATTVHGYEGSGRVFTKLLLDQLPRPLRTYEASVPIRYCPGDPLEDWLYTTFMLRTRESGKPDIEGAQYTVLDPGELAENPEAFQEAYSVLVLAHYRNEPDDIMVMLDAPHHGLRALRSRGGMPALLEYSVEEPAQPREARLVLDRLALYCGDHDLRGLRIVRIAVHPEVQRRGLGSRLLAGLEDEARRQGYDYVGSIFSRHEVLGFWLRKGYLVTYISPRYNRATGEKNLAVAKPLTRRGEECVERAAKALKLRLLLSGHSIYRDLAAEKIAQLLLHNPYPVDYEIPLTKEQRRRLEEYLSGGLEYEAAHDALYPAIISTLARTPGDTLSRLLGEEGLVAVIARVVQGKPLDEVAAILREDPGSAAELVDRSARHLLRHIAKD